MTVIYDAIEMRRLIELAKKRKLVNSVEIERPQYVVKIGAGTFQLDNKGAREFLVRFLRSHGPDRI